MSPFSNRRMYKYSKPTSELSDEIWMTMPVGAVIRAVGNQAESLCFWAEVEQRETRTAVRYFRVAGTGHPLEPARYYEWKEMHYLGTVQFLSGNLVFHIYELIPVESKESP